MNDFDGTRPFGEGNNSNESGESNLIAASDGTQRQSHADYWFDEDEPTWKLNKSIAINVGETRKLLDKELQTGFTKTLAHYAMTMSANHTQNMNSRLKSLLLKTKSTTINTTMLINFRASLNSETEHHLGALRGFLYEWRNLGYYGISDDVVDLLQSWTLRGNIKGDAVKRLDPKEGPLTDNEQLAFNEGAVLAFEKGKISLAELSFALLASHTGRRPKQVVHTKNCDLDDTKKNKKGETMYLINIPRAKQRGETFRESHKTFAMTRELWVVLEAQRKNCIASVENVLGYELQDVDRHDLPIFPDLDSFRGITSVTELRSLLATDYLHLKSGVVTDTLQKIVTAAAIYSERTGDLLNIFATRFRYTMGTRAAREGFGLMVIAELLDQSDTQNVGVYTKNLPDHARALNKAMALQLAPYAQAFQGVLVDREEFAERGRDLTSRIKYRGNNTATCGQYGFCGANAPIPCYTCMHFQPWLEGPHEEVLVDLLAEREEVEKITGDSTMAAINDRTILAVVNVIQRCDARRNELAQKNNMVQ